MTTVYFVRHCQADNTVRDDAARPLTEKGMRDRALVTEYLRDKGITHVLSSPYKRAVDTLAGFAEEYGHAIEAVYDFRERKSDSDWLRDSDFWPFIQRQWADFDYSLSDGESLRTVQTRNIAALNDALTRSDGQSIAIGTHGTALSTIISYYDSAYGYDDFAAMVNILPWVVEMKFDGTRFAGYEKINLFHLDEAPDFSAAEVKISDFGTHGAYKFVVIFARYQGKWLYCRAKGRDVYETAGGRIEHGETPIEAARRELYEETGATEFDITPAFDYAVRFPNSLSYGQVFLAEIRELSALPDEFEMAEIVLLDGMPDKMRFSAILPVLYERINAIFKY